MLLKCGVEEDSLESLGLQGDPISPSLRKSVLNIHWKDWCWSWNSSTLATRWEDLTHWERASCWERLKAGEEGDIRGWDGWMASPTRWIWVWVNSGSWWWTGKPGVLQSMGLQRIVHDWVTELTDYWLKLSPSTHASMLLLSRSLDSSYFILFETPDIQIYAYSLEKHYCCVCVCVCVYDIFI